MKKFKINLFVEDFVNKSDFGRVSVQLDDYIFPDKNWTDFGRIIIGWWLDAVCKLALDNQTKAVCSFMDGPYRFSLTKIKKDIWKVQFFEERGEVKIFAEGEVDASQVINEMLTAFQKIENLYEDEKNFEKVKVYQTFRKEVLTRLKINC